MSLARLARPREAAGRPAPLSSSSPGEEGAADPHVGAAPGTDVLEASPGTRAARPPPWQPHLTTTGGGARPRRQQRKVCFRPRAPAAALGPPRRTAATRRQRSALRRHRLALGRHRPAHAGGGGEARPRRQQRRRRFRLRAPAAALGPPCRTSATRRQRPAFLTYIQLDYFLNSSFT